MEDEISGASDFRDLPLMPACLPACPLYLFMHRIEVILCRCVYVRIFCTRARALALALAQWLWQSQPLTMYTVFSTFSVFLYITPQAFYLFLHKGKFCRVNGNHTLMDESPNNYLNIFIYFFLNLIDLRDISFPNANEARYFFKYYVRIKL